MFFIKSHILCCFTADFQCAIWSVSEIFNFLRFITFLTFSCFTAILEHFLRFGGLVSPFYVIYRLNTSLGSRSSPKLFRPLDEPVSNNTQPKPQTAQESRKIVIFWEIAETSTIFHVFLL